MIEDMGEFLEWVLRRGGIRYRKLIGYGDNVDYGVYPVFSIYYLGLDGRRHCVDIEGDTFLDLMYEFEEVKGNEN